MIKVEEAILNLSDILGKLHGSIEIDDDLKESVRMAIKSLQAWDKVLNEMEADYEKITSCPDTMTETDEIVAVTLGTDIQTIKRFLKGIEQCDTKIENEDKYDKRRRSNKRA